MSLCPWFSCSRLVVLMKPLAHVVGSVAVPLPLSFVDAVAFWSNFTSLIHWSLTHIYQSTDRVSITLDLVTWCYSCITSNNQGKTSLNDLVNQMQFSSWCWSYKSLIAPVLGRGSSRLSGCHVLTFWQQLLIPPGEGRAQRIHSNELRERVSHLGCGATPFWRFLLFSVL